jgi:hypothetical protein
MRAPSWLTDGKTQLAIVVADSCMMSREVLDEAKSDGLGEDGHTGGSHADLRHACALGPGFDGMSRYGCRSELCAFLKEKLGRSHRGG